MRFLQNPETKTSPQPLEFTGEIATLIHTIENSSYEKCLEHIASHIKTKLSYNQFFKALYLSAIRKNNSHHEVYSLFSAHHLGLGLPSDKQYLPLLWHLKSLKKTQNLFPAPTRTKPTVQSRSAPQTKNEFHDAMNTWDFERATPALLALTKQMGPSKAMYELWKYATRDWGAIGHKGIAIANCSRTLKTLNWQCSEATFVFLLDTLNEKIKGNEDQQSYLSNQERTQKAMCQNINEWEKFPGDSTATNDILLNMRTGNVNDACEQAIQMLINNKISATTLWDAIFLAAAELPLRFNPNDQNPYRPGCNMVNRPVHANTSANALHYFYRNTKSSEARLLITLQAIGWMTEFTRAETKRDMLRDISVINLKSDISPESSNDITEDIFSHLGSQPVGDEPHGYRYRISTRENLDIAAKKAFTLASSPSHTKAFTTKAQNLLFQKATPNHHDIKFPTAVFENLNFVSPIWRGHLLATSVHWLHGYQSPDATHYQTWQTLQT